MTDAEFVRELAQPLGGESNDYDALLELIGNARIVLLGEASHGTHEFYFERAQITKRLIAEKNFTVLAIEADWPDASRVHRYVRGSSNDANASEALAGFRRFPTWMWRNTVVVEFVEWLRQFNKDVDPKRAPAGFYGMDLYSLHGSINAVLNYLEKVDPESAKRARLRYSCFDHFSREPQEYGYAATVGAAESCENAVVEQLIEIQRKAAEFLSRDGAVAAEELFHETGLDRFWIDLRDVGEKVISAVYGPRLERAIGVIYRPESERLSHYFHARLPKQFDAIIHIDETRAVEPLERTSVWDEGELPETYPFKV